MILQDAQPGAQTLHERWLHARLACLRLRLRRRCLWMKSMWEGGSVGGFRGSVIPGTEVDALLDADCRERELLFYAEDPEASAITARLADVESALDAEARQLLEENEPPALVAISAGFGLGAIETDALVMAAANELDPAFARVFAYLQDDASATSPTGALIWQTLSSTRVEGAGEDELGHFDATEFLGDSAPLRWYRLVNADAPPAAPIGSASFTVDARVAIAMTGRDSIDPRLAAMASRVIEAPASRAIDEAADRLAGLLAARGPAVLNLIGAGDRGQEGLASAIGRQLGLEFISIDALALREAGSPVSVARLLDRECALTPLLPLITIDGRDQVEDTSAVISVVEAMHGSVVVASVGRLSMARRVFVERMGRFDAEAQKAVWVGALGAAGAELNGELDRVVGRFDFGPLMISRAARVARDAATMRAGSGEASARVGVDDLVEACRGGFRWTLDDLAQRIDPIYDWDDIVLPDRELGQLREIVTHVEQRTRVLGSWGFGAKMSRGRGLNAMFAGPSGAGKTMAAEIIAKRLGLDLYRIDLAGVVNKYIGETEKRLRSLFDAAECTGAILFFDEADALFGKRTEVKDSHDRYANIEVSYLLQRLEEYSGLAILATNKRSSVDQAFLRRLRFIVDFPFPSAQDRRRIWEGVIPDRAPTEGIDLDALARLEVTGGNIRSIALNAAFMAAGTSQAIGMRHLMAAARNEYTKIERLVNESEFGEHYREARHER
ncbi:MAG: ATP-binding protein [Phycisphaerales bacterium]